MRYIILVFLLSVAVRSDLSTSKIPNAFVLAGIISGLLLNAAHGGWDGLKSGILGSLLPVILLGVFFYAGLMGAGDIKLFCSIGALGGWKFGLYAMAYSFLCAGITILTKSVFKTGITVSFSEFYRDMKVSLLTKSFTHLNDRGRNRIIKLSPAIAAGTLIQLLVSWAGGTGQ